MRAHRILAVAVAGVMTLGSCGGDDSGSSDDTVASTVGTSDVCAAREQLKSAITDLGEVNLLEDGTDAVRDYIDRVRSAVDDLKAAAEDEYTDEVAAIEDALQGVEDALDDGLSVDNLRSATESVGDLLTSSGDLVQKIEAAC